MKVVNLSRRPFLNSRPVVRLATFLWLVGGLLLAANLGSYASNAVKFADSQQQLEAIGNKIQHDQDAIRRLDKELSGLAIGEQNEQAAFLNTLIARRTFPWSLLFEQLEGILPQDVRLLQVRPEIQLAALPGVRQTRAEDNTRSRRTRRTQRTAASSTAPTSDRVQLRILGMARSDDPLLDFVDALFASPHFEKPVLHQERRDTTGELRFQLDVVYLLAPPEAKTEESPADATTAPQMVLGDAGAARPEAGAPTDAGPGTVAPGMVPSRPAEKTTPETDLATRSAEQAPTAQVAVPTLRREPGAPPPVVTGGDRPVYLSPAAKRRLEAEAAARTAELGDDSGDGRSDDDGALGGDEPSDDDPRSDGKRDDGQRGDERRAGSSAGVVFGTPVAPAQTGTPAASPRSPGAPTAGAPTPETTPADVPIRQRPTLERPRLGPPPTNLGPEASASPRVRRGGRP